MKENVKKTEEKLIIHQKLTLRLYNKETILRMKNEKKIQKIE